MDEDQYSEERIPCSICGRSFAPEVLKKHSNVCKKSAATAAKRKPFDSSKQRVLEGELSLKQIKEAQKKLKKLCSKRAQDLQWPAILRDILDLNPDENPGITTTKRRIGALEFTVGDLDDSVVCLMTENLKDIEGCSTREIKPPKSHWREKHQDFISAVRNARGLQAAISSGGPLPPPPPPSANPDYVQCPHCSRRFNQSAAERHISFCKDKQSKLPKDKPGPSASAKPNTRANFQPTKPKAKTASTSSTSITSSTGPTRPTPSATKAPLKGPAPAAKTSSGGQISLVKNSTLGSNSSTRQTVAKVPTGASSSTRMPTAGSSSSTRIATGGSASSTRITAGGSNSTTQITSANATPSTKHSAAGPVVSAQTPAGDANSMAKKPTASLASSSRIPGSSASSTKIPSGNAAPATKIPTGSAPSSRIPVGGASSTRIPVGGVARGRAIPVAQDEEAINLDRDETFTAEMHQAAGTAKHKMISWLSLAAESDLSVCIDNADVQETERLQFGESHPHGLDVVRSSSRKSANKDRKLHKKQGPRVETEPYCSDEGLLNTLHPQPLNDYKVSVHHLSRDAKHKATDSTTKVTPVMCNLQVNVSKVSEDLSSQLHHHHVHLQQHLFDHKPSPEYTQLLPGKPLPEYTQLLPDKPSPEYTPLLPDKPSPEYTQLLPGKPLPEYTPLLPDKPSPEYTPLLPDIQLHCHSHQAGPANNYVCRYSGRYEILNAGSKMSNNYFNVGDGFRRARETFTSSVTNAQSYCLSASNVDSYVQDANVFSSARCSDQFEILQANFCHVCGVRYPVSCARFCCLCGTERLKFTISSAFRNHV